MAELDVKELAAYIQKKYYEEKQKEISPIKLQKALYFLFAYWGGTVRKSKLYPNAVEEDFSNFDEYLFEDKIEAWVYGPVIPVVYREKNISKYNNESMFKGKEKLKEFSEKLQKPVIPISCISEENLDNVLYKCVELLRDGPIWPVYKEEDKEEVFNLNDEEDIFDIVKRKEGYYEIIGDRVIRTYNLINISTDEGMLRLLTYLNKIGVDEKLHEIGARTGDTVKIADFEFEYYE